MSVQETTLEIHLDNLQHNVRQLKKHLKEGTRFLAVVKANSYGTSQGWSYSSYSYFPPSVGRF